MDKKLMALPILFLGLILFAIILKDIPIDQQYFFFNDGELLLSEDTMIHYWEIGVNPTNEQTYGNISNGVGYVSMNESTGSDWGWSSFSQGDCPWKIYPDMLYGKTFGEAVNIPYDWGVEFRRNDIPEQGEYFLTSKVYLDEREYVHDVESGDPKCNMGVVLYCSYELNGQSQTYFGEAQSEYNEYLAIDVYFSSSFWNGSTFEPIDYDDVTTRNNGYTIFQTAPNQLQTEDTWKSYNIDMNWVLTKTFNKLPSNVTSIMVRAVQFYVEGSGTFISARFDYLQMVLS